MVFSLQKDDQTVVSLHAVALLAHLPWRQCSSILVIDWRSDWVGDCDDRWTALPGIPLLEARVVHVILSCCTRSYLGIKAKHQIKACLTTSFLGRFPECWLSPGTFAINGRSELRAQPMRLSQSKPLSGHGRSRVQFIGGHAAFTRAR